MGVPRVERVVPYSEEHERGCLGSVLLEPSAFLLLKAEWRLCADAFYIPGHRLVWEAMEALAAEGRPLDQVTVTDQLRRLGQLEKCGGPLFVDGIIENTPTAAHVEFYGEQVAGYWNRRRAIDAGRRVESLAMDPEAGDGKAAAAKGVEILCEVLEERVEKPGPGARLNAAVEKWRAQAGFRERGEAPPLLGLATGLDRLDEMLNGLKPGLIVLGARQSTGKTAMEGQWCCERAHEGDPVLRTTKDSTEQELWERDLCRTAGVSLAKMERGWMFGKQEQVVMDSAALMAEWPVRIEDEPYLIRDVIGVIRADVAKRGTKLVTLDYIQLYRTGNPRLDENGNARMDEVAARLKRTSLKLNIPLVALSQFARDKDGLRGMRGCNWLDSRPVMEDLKDCGSIEQMATVVILMSKVADVPDENGHVGKVTIVAVDVAKHKGGGTGPIFMRFDRPYFKFTELTKLEQEAVMKFLHDEKMVKVGKKNESKLKEPVFKDVQDAIDRAREMPARGAGKE